MIRMPESYDSICKKKGILAETIYQLIENPLPRTSWFEYANLVMYSTARGVFQLYYALKSFPRPTDNRRFILFFVTKSGIFTSTNSVSHLNEPIDFNVIRCKHYCDFGRGNLMTLIPGTREIIVLDNYRYTEVIDGKGVPNTYDWNKHKQEYACNMCCNHKLVVESDNYSPIELDYDDELYAHLRANAPYLWLRSDNYVDLNNIVFCRQPY